MILIDNETKVDLLNNEPIAATIVRLLKKQHQHPVTIGVHGDWGAGKSSVLEMIDAALAGDEGVLCLKFNGWRFQGFEDAKIALLEGIVTGLVEKKPALTKASGALRKVFKRIDWLKVAKRAGGLALTATTGIPLPEHVDAVINGLKGIAADPGKLATKENLESVIEEAKGFLKPEGDSKNVPEEIGEFRKAFDELLDEAKVKQLVVLIDDLDRCLPDTAIETLEAIRLFVFTPRTAFVVAADEAMIEYAVRRHFPELTDTSSRDYARNYLEKLIQVPFRIPALGEAETRTYVTLLLIGSALGENDTEYSKLIALAREQLKRPWEAGALDASAIKKVLGEKAPAAHSALTLSDQIGPILASGAKGNPRQIKRFLNSLILRKETAEARGFGDLIKLGVLAKLMLAERFIPRLFDQVASVAAADPKGCCEDLAQLEDTVSNEAKAAAPSKAGKGASAEADEKKAPSGVLGEWVSSPAIAAWARIQPPLAKVDLRPYLFVAKDRKDHFGAISVLGHLATVVEKLLGPKMTVQGMEQELRQLAAPEASKAFDAVRGRIMATGTFETEPPGVAGLQALVKAHPHLQGPLVDFLENLPRDTLGPWVIAGWTGVITATEARPRLEKLIQAWAATSDNTMLKAAADKALKAPGGKR